MYCDVWKFAGIVRMIELNNVDYSPCFNIRQELMELARDLKIWHEHKTYPLTEMVAIFHEKLLTIHPFRDGNGRWARVLTEYICLKLKIIIPTWGIKIIDDEERRKKYIESVKMARYKGHYDDLIAIMFN
jgi:fido (protein-threonine AMPylation protein)